MISPASTVSPVQSAKQRKPITLFADCIFAELKFISAPTLHLHGMKFFIMSRKKAPQLMGCLFCPRRDQGYKSEDVP